MSYDHDRVYGHTLRNPGHDPCMEDAGSISDSQILELKQEATTAGDEEALHVINHALGGDEAMRGKCAEVLNAKQRAKDEADG